MTALVPIVLAMHRRMRPGRSPESGEQANWTNEKGARHAVSDWARAWPGAFANNEEKIKRVDLYVDLLAAHPWITASCWRDTVEWRKWNHHRWHPAQCNHGWRGGHSCWGPDD